MQNIKTIAGTFTIGTYEIPKQYVCAKVPQAQRYQRAAMHMGLWKKESVLNRACAEKSGEKL